MCPLRLFVLCAYGSGRGRLCEGGGKMKWFYDRKISTKLLSGFFLMVLLMVCVGWVGISQISSVAQADRMLYDVVTLPTNTLLDVSKSFLHLRMTARDGLIAATKEDRQKYADQSRKLLAESVAGSEKYGGSLNSKEAKDIYQHFADSAKTYGDDLNRFYSLLDANKKDEALAFMYGEWGAVGRSMDDDLQKMQNNRLAFAETTSSSNTALAGSATRNMMILIGVGLAIGTTLGVWLSRIIANPIKQVAERAEKLQSVCITNLGKAAEAMARGDLNVHVVTDTEPLHINTKDELGALAGSMNGIIAKTQVTVASFEQAMSALRTLIEEDGGATLLAAANKDLTARVKRDYQGAYDKMKSNINTLIQSLDDALVQVALAAEQVASASGQISSGSQTLSQGASEQASSLEEVSSSLQEMASMTKQNAANAKEGRSLAEGAKTAADLGVESMKRLSDAINKIKVSSDSTAKIVKTIDEIAFQTNLLALNAAVEAARAGDAGKGFAVVAEEVRNLAMRSAEAAKNTANMIEESVKNAEGGVAINQEVLKNLSEINGQVNKVTTVMAEIAAASEQQSQGVEQVNTAVEQMNQVTQQVAANAEESASAAEELTGQSEEMKSMVALFHLTNAASGGSRPVHAPARRHAVTAAVAQVRKGKEPPMVKPNGGSGRIDPAKVIPLDEADKATLCEF